MTTDDKTLTEQIETALLEAIGAIEESGFKTVWVPDMFIDPADLSAAVLPIIRKAQADAWQAGVNFALPRAETTHFARHNPHRTKEARS